ncbi:MAG: isochorismatase hydrolase, partial [Ilumatobacteraceae bacterium]|nr:isochorismatase hydrolase [Ilumatobacteraceae bacterium]
FFLTENPFARGIVPNIQSMATSLRAAGGTIAWVLPATDVPSPARVEFLGPIVAEVYRSSGGEGPLRDRLWHEFDIGPDDLLVEKTAAGAFFPGRCDLPALLEQRGIDTVLIAGTVANVCCESTARDASTRGYRVIMVADANAAIRDADLNATLHTIYRSFGDVRPTSDVLELLAMSLDGPVPP